MVLTRAKLERFTAFESLDIEFSPGINVFVGENGTGKTHLMKACYAACDVTTSKSNFAEKLVSTFLPRTRAPGRLVKRRVGRARCSVTIFGQCREISASFSTQVRTTRSVNVRGAKTWIEQPIRSAYIPVKDMLANAPGFRSLYETTELHFEEVYADVLNRAFRPPLRGPHDAQRRSLLANLRRIVGGRVHYENEEFVLSNKGSNLEFTLLAEGMRKLGLIWLLIQNGTLGDSSVLFWDEPETNLNPKLFGVVIDALLTLQRNGVQVFLATHDYVILKELDLRMTDDDDVAFHSLYRDPETEEINCGTVNRLEHLHPNAILDTFSDLYNRDVAESLKRFHKPA